MSILEKETLRKMQKNKKFGNTKCQNVN